MAPSASKDARPPVDVVIVAYRSGDHLRGAVEPLVGLDGVQVIVVDNASPDDSVEAVADLPISIVQNQSNLGFAKACNIGWRHGTGRYVLFLNPDARIGEASLTRLVERLERDGPGLAGPRTVTSAGELVHSQRRFVGVAAVWAQVFFLHRVLGDGASVDGIIREAGAYEQTQTPDWLSGACMLLPRDVLETLGGFDERFFMYCEDRDLCRRIRRLGLEVVFEPAATAVHDEGSSAPSWRMAPVLVRSQVAYTEKYLRGWRRIATRIGIALHEAVRVVVVRGGRSARAGHFRGLIAALTPSRVAQASRTARAAERLRRRPVASAAKAPAPSCLHATGEAEMLEERLGLSCRGHDRGSSGVYSVSANRRREHR